MTDGPQIKWSNPKADLPKVTISVTWHCMECRSEMTRTRDCWPTDQTITDRAINDLEEAGWDLGGLVLWWPRCSKCKEANHD